LHLLKSFDELADVMVKALVIDFPRIAKSKFFQIGRKRFCIRHPRTIDQDWHHADALFQDVYDF